MKGVFRPAGDRATPERGEAAAFASRHALREAGAMELGVLVLLPSSSSIAAAREANTTLLGFWVWNSGSVAGVVSDSRLVSRAVAVASRHETAGRERNWRSGGLRLD